MSAKKEQIQLGEIQFEAFKQHFEEVGFRNHSKIQMSTFYSKTRPGAENVS